MGRAVAFKISMEERPDFKGEISAFLFNVAGNLLEAVKVKEGKASFSRTEDEFRHGRLFIAPVPDQAGEPEQKPTIKMMERMGAYEHVVMPREKLVNKIRVPSNIIDMWPFCLCLVRGQVVKAESGLPVCGAKVHTCEVDKVWRWILRLPDKEVFRFRNDLLKIFDEPLLKRPPRPEPDPSPFKAMRKGLSQLGKASLNPQPEPPGKYLISSRALSVPMAEVSVNPQPEPSVELGQMKAAASVALPIDVRVALTSASAPIVRTALIDNVRLIIPYLCLMWPWWWRYRCDEISVVETDALGRFQTLVGYLCKGDKPDLYFWVEYELDGTLETVYRPFIACHTYWNYACGSDVTIRISDERVPACNNGPDLPGCTVQILSIGHKISMSEIQGPGAAANDEGLTTSDEPFGGKLEPRVWFSRTTLRDTKNVKYYRWSYRRLTEGDGTPLATPGSWTPLTRTVVRHYAVPVPGGVAHVPSTMGPRQPMEGSDADLFEIRPMSVPAGGIGWTVVDEREDLASAHFETDKLGSGADACARAFDSAGKYELKLELFKENGDLVDWTAEGIDLMITDVQAPFGTESVTAVTASDYHRIKDEEDHTVAFRMVLRVDNNCCQAEVEPVEGSGLTATPCGFIEYAPDAWAALKFNAHHPNGFATFRFSVVRGVSTNINEASTAKCRLGIASVPTANPNDPARAYALTLPSSYREDFYVVTELLGAIMAGEIIVAGPCTRAAFSEALHVWTMATDGYNRLWRLDAFDHDGFALTPSP